MFIQINCDYVKKMIKLLSQIYASILSKRVKSYQEVIIFFDLINGSCVLVGLTKPNVLNDSRIYLKLIKMPKLCNMLVKRHDNNIF